MQTVPSRKKRLSELPSLHGLFTLPVLLCLLWLLTLPQPLVLNSQQKPCLAHRSTRWYTTLS